MLKAVKALMQSAMLMLLFMAAALGAPPPLSPYAGDVIINEIQVDGSNSLDFVELYFVETTDVTNWELHTNGPGGSADSDCTLPGGLYAAGTFLVIDGSVCLDWHPEQREIYILDDNGDLVHYVSLWHTGNQSNGGDFGDPADFPAGYEDAVTDLNDLPDDFVNYCAEIDGSTPTGDWNEDGQSCTSTEGTSNSGDTGGTGGSCSFEPGLTARYYNNLTMLGYPVIEQPESQVDYTWGTGSPNASLLGNDVFSANWSGYLYAPTSGEYRIRTNSDDGVRFYLSGTLLIDNWGGHGATYDEFTINLSAGQYYPIKLEYFEDGGSATIELEWRAPGDGSFATIPAANLFHCTSNEACSGQSGLVAEYYSNRDLSGFPDIEQVDDNIDNNWGSGSPDASTLGNDDFSVRWTGVLQVPTTGQYRIRTNSDDGVRLYLAETLLIDRWNDHSATYDEIIINLDAGQSYTFMLEYYEHGGSARIELDWQTPGSGSFVPIPASAFTQCHSQIPEPVLEWRMDDSQWTGTAGEVTDHSGNNRNGTAQNQTSTSLGYLCRAGTFDGADDYLTHSDIGALLGGTASMSFWIQTTQTGNDTNWQAPGIAGGEVAGSTSDIFWGWLDASGRIGISVGNDGSTKSTQAINDGIFHHVVLTRDAAAGAFKIYIDGNLDASGSIAAGVIGTSFTSIGRIEDSAGTPEYFQGALDELVIFDEVLSNAQVTSIYDNQSNARNLDGTDRDLSNCLAAQQCFSQDFNSGSLGSDWQTMNSSGSFGNPRIVNGRLRLTNDTNNVATAATLLRQFPSAGNKLVVEFDYYAYKDDGSTNAADGITLTLSDRDIPPYPGGYGGSLGYTQRTDGGGVDGFNGGWLGIGLDEWGNYSNPTEGREGGIGAEPNAVAIRGPGSGQTGYEYIAGTSTLTPTVLTDSSNSHRYRITVDHSNGSDALVTVERDTNSDDVFETLVNTFDLFDSIGDGNIPSQVVLTLTGSTGGSSANHEIDNLEVQCNTVELYDTPIHHFELVRNQANGLTCEPLDVTIRACGNADCSTTYNGTFDITLSPTTDWASGNTFTSLSHNDTVSFGPTTAGTYTLEVLDSEPSTAPLTETLCFVGGSTTPEADCSVTFNDTGLRFFPSDNSGSATAYFDLIAGSEESGLSVQAVQTNTTTGICEALFTDGGTLNFEGGSGCSDPGTCSSGQEITLTNSDGTATTLPNDGSSLTTIPLVFGADSTANFSLDAPDVGIQPLTVRYELPDADGNPSGNVITQTVNLRVAPAELRLSSITGSNGTMNPATTEAGLISSGHFAKAGETFQLSVQAFNADGLPTPNFGRTNTLPTIDWTHSLVEPDSGVAGDFTATSDGNQWQVDGADSSVITFASGSGLVFSEVGIITLQGTIESYLPVSGSPDLVVDSNTRLVGRFIPDHLDVSQVAGSGTVQNAHSGFSYQGQTLNWATPLALSVTGRNANDQITRNYDSNLWNLTPTSNEPVDNNVSFTKGTGTLGGNLLMGDATAQVIDDGTAWNGTRHLTLGANTFTFQRDTALADLDANDAPFNFALNVSFNAAYLTDSDGACYDPDLNDTCDPLSLSNIATGAFLYYGRVRLESAQGPETTDLALPLTLEVWNWTGGSGSFVPATQESSGGNSNLIAGNFGITGSEPASLAAQTSVNAVNYSNGVGTITLAAPGAGNTGSVEVEGTGVGAHLWFDWDDTGSASVPAATGYFGLYQGRPPILYQLDGFR